MEKPEVDAAGEDPQIRVRLPVKPPVLYPQAARVLLRMVVRLAQNRCEADEATQSEEKAS